MKTIANLILVSILTISLSNLIAAPSNWDNKSVEEEKAVKTLTKAVIAFENVMENPETSIPQDLINESEGIVIFPGAIKVALGTIGGQGARGIAMIRLEDGSWSNPFFVSLGEGSLGCQIGVQSSDIVLLFKDRKDIMDIYATELNLGVDASAVAGPANAGSSTNIGNEFDAEIYTYSLNKGLFVGISLSGSVLSYNEDVNDAYYNKYYVNMDEIFYEIETPYNDKVNDLIAALNMYGEQIIWR